MKLPGILRYLIALIILAYLALALIIGITVALIVTRPFQDYGGRLLSSSVGWSGYIGVPLAIATTAAIVILAYWPIHYIYKNTNFFKDNFGNS